MPDCSPLGISFTMLKAPSAEEFGILLISPKYSLADCENRIFLWKTKLSKTRYEQLYLKNNGTYFFHSEANEEEFIDTKIYLDYDPGHAISYMSPYSSEIYRIIRGLTFFPKNENYGSVQILSYRGEKFSIFFYSTQILVINLKTGEVHRINPGSSVFHMRQFFSLDRDYPERVYFMSYSQKGEWHEALEGNPYFAYYWQLDEKDLAENKRDYDNGGDDLGSAYREPRVIVEDESSSRFEKYGEYFSLKNYETGLGSPSHFYLDLKTLRVTKLGMAARERFMLKHNNQLLTPFGLSPGTNEHPTTKKEGAHGWMFLCFL